MWVVWGLLLLPVLLCCFSTIRRDINSLPWYPFSVTISLLLRLWEKPVYVLQYTHTHTHTHTPLTQMGKVQCELCKRKRCYNHSSVTGLVKSASWIVINYAAVIFVLWVLFNDAVNCDILAVRSGVVEVFFLQGCYNLSHCNRCLKIPRHFPPWRWDHYATSNREKVTQWLGVLSLMNWRCKYLRLFGVVDGWVNANRALVEWW
jgi:hypothetical protein